MLRNAIDHGIESPDERLALGKSPEGIIRLEATHRFGMLSITLLEEDITDFIGETEIYLNAGDGVVLYTDGISEAENEWGELYGIERLCEIISQIWQFNANEIKDMIINDVRQHIGKQQVYDDITLLILK